MIVYSDKVCRDSWKLAAKTSLVALCTLGAPLVLLIMPAAIFDYGIVGLVLCVLIRPVMAWALKRDCVNEIRYRSLILGGIGGFLVWMTDLAVGGISGAGFEQVAVAGFVWLGTVALTRKKTDFAYLFQANSGVEACCHSASFAGLSTVFTLYLGVGLTERSVQAALFSIPVDFWLPALQAAIYFVVLTPMVYLVLTKTVHTRALWIVAAISLVAAVVTAVLGNMYMVWMAAFAVWVIGLSIIYVKAGKLAGDPPLMVGGKEYN